MTTETGYETVEELLENDPELVSDMETMGFDPEELAEVGDAILDLKERFGDHTFHRAEMLTQGLEYD